PVLSAAAPFKSGGRQGWSYYTDIPAGPLAIKNVADLYIYPNTVKAMLITGADVKEWLEMSAGQFNRIDPQGAPEQQLINPAYPSYNFDTLDGVSYALDVTEPAKYTERGVLAAPTANRVKHLMFQGKPIDPTAQFVVATNNYRAFGGGNFPGITAAKVIFDAPEENREVLIQYLTGFAASTGQTALNPSADNNWRIQPVPGVKLRFLSASEATQYVGQHPGIHWVKDNGDGSALFELTK
ncbi:MAG: 5'-nucleotidase C-terminal domain-containing protein, partial [Rhodoferax sp.]|nr:5'-nucleotidase C-terminal domain-containing protein [Rhodoferax sp.]